MPQTDNIQNEAFLTQLDNNQPAEKTDIEKQLDSFVAQREDWMVTDETDWWGYAVTDLNQDGNWELIASENHGTGHYTTTAIYALDADCNLHQISIETSCDDTILEELALYGGPLRCSPLIMPHLVNTGGTQSYPVYYNAGQYYYLYEDDVTMKGAEYGAFQTLREFSLEDEADGVLLGYEKTVYHGDYTSVEWWDLAGNYAGKEAYHDIVTQRYSGFTELEARILWVECPHTGDMTEDALYALLKQSMDSFSVGERPMR